MRLACTLALTLVSGCLAEQVAAPVTTIPSPRIEIRETRLRPGTIGWVVDGLAYRWPGDSVRLSQLKTEDIESIEILRGSAASQSYPTFQCSAIIVVTTKAPTCERSGGTKPGAPGCMPSAGSPTSRHH